MTATTVTSRPAAVTSGPTTVTSGPTAVVATMAPDAPAASEPSISRAAAFAEGARDIVPMAMSVVPFGLAIGAAVGASSIPALAGWLSGPLIFAGSAQLSTVEMLDDGATPLVIVLAALVINARIMMYGAALAPWFREERLARRLLLAFPLVDPIYLVTAARFDRGDLDRRARQAYYAGAAVLLGGVWVLTQTLALIAGARLPAGVGLQIAAPLALVGLLAKSTTGKPALVAAGVAAVVAVLGAGLPFQSAVLFAALVGVAAGGVHAARTETAESPEESS